jgi:glycerophosphoryl diester phosphodiesterase
MYEQLPRPTIFAHRGASAHAPENTLAAFELALRQGADAIELDAKLSADGQVVVIHDQTVDRTTNGQGDVKDLTLSELRRLDAGSHFDVAFQGEPIPTLEEVIKAVGQLTYINVELTNYASPRDSLSDKVAELVKRYKLVPRVFFSSFLIFPLLRIHRLLPEVPISLLLAPGKRGKLSRSLMNRFVPHHNLHLALRDVTGKLVEEVHKQSRKIFVYTVNEETDLRRLFELGVDGVFTDDPLLAQAVLKDVQRSTP